MTDTRSSPAARIVTPVITSPQTQRLIPFLGERLTLHHGPAFEQFVTAGAGDDIPDPARLAEVAAAHGIDIVGPPPAP